MPSNENNGTKNNDIKDLRESVAESNLIVRYKNMITRNKFVFAILIMVLVFQSIFVGVQCHQNNFYKQSHKMQYLSTYLVEQKITTQDRKREAMQRVMRVGLHYQPRINERLLAQASEIIYDTGELIYGISTEEWIILFSHEGAWKRNALSPKNARGPGQIMPVIGRSVANELGIRWRGVDTLYDYLDNIKISMRWYFNLKSQYPDPNIYITTYFWGEQEMGKFIKRMGGGEFEFKSLTGRYTRYLEAHKKTKEDVENVLGIKIFIQGLYE